MPQRINRAVKTCNRGAFSHFVYNYSLPPPPYLFQFMIMLLPFCPADRHRLLPSHHLLPAALFPQSWLLSWKASTFVLSLPDSFSFGSWPQCQGLARKSLLFCVLERWKWQSRSDRFSIALCSAVLLSFRELPPWRWSCKLIFLTLFWRLHHKYPVSSLIVWRFAYVSLLQK